MRALALVLVAAMPASAALTEDEYADARAATLVEATNQELAGRLRLSAALDACGDAALARATQLSLPERRKLVRDSISAVIASPRAVARPLAKVNGPELDSLVMAVSVDLAAFQVGYMNATQAWKFKEPAICTSFRDLALRTIAR